MGHLFEEIDNRESPLGQLSLRRRRIPAVSENDIYEVKLGDEFLMSSLFVDAEVALAELGLASLEDRELRVVVGGLGLGYTAGAALDDARVGELLVVEALEAVIDWHREEKVPLGAVLNADPRCRYVHGDFFRLAVQPQTGFDPDRTGRTFDAVLLDIDHSPEAVLNEGSADFYTPANLHALARQIRPGGVFAMWSNEPPDERFQQTLGSVFADVAAHVVSFYNPFQHREAANTVYVAVSAA